jgi:SAM-dependent methyltransferase
MSLLDQFHAPLLRDCWVRWGLHRVHYADRTRKLDLLYRVENPWRMDSAQEQARFAWTNGVIATRLPRPETLLEIGCGEGHQSQYLTRVCRRLYGTDISSRAVRRARQRCPDAAFATGDPFAFRFVDMPPVVDLVAACEVVYYVKDTARFIERMSTLGRACLATYYEGHAQVLDRHFVNLPGCERERFRFGDVGWIAVWWRNERTG